MPPSVLPNAAPPCHRSGLPVLDERLRVIAAQVRPGRVVADIGSDHAYLVSFLVGSGVCPTGIAADVGAPPLERSRKTVECCGLTERIRLVQSDGLSRLREEEADDIVIAGMGGDMMVQILDAARWHNPEKRFLLQPMTRASQLRRWLCANGYHIEAEHAACARRFCYTVLTVRYTGQPTPCGDLFAAVGLLAYDASPAALAYRRGQGNRTLKKARGLSRTAGRGEEAARYLALAQEILAGIGETTND